MSTPTMPDDFMPSSTMFKKPQRRTTFLASDNAPQMQQKFEEAVQRATEDGFNVEFFEQRTVSRDEGSGMTYTVTIIWRK